MRRRRAAPTTSAKPTTSASATPAGNAVWIAALVVALAAISWAVFGRAVDLYFSQDDFAALARARGLIPRLDSPQRYLSHQLWFDALNRIGGLDPRPYHVANILLHMGCALLLHRLLSRWLTPAGAFFGAAILALHPAQFHALYWIIAAGDSLALGFALAALLAALVPGRSRWWAVPLHVLSLLSKESTLTFPAVMLIVRGFDARRRGASGPATLRALLLDPVFLACLAVSIAWVALIAARREAAAGIGNDPYAFEIGPHLGANLLTYLGWTAQVLRVTLRGFTDAIDPRVFPYGIAALVVAIAGALVPALRARGWIEGTACFALLLLPLLPLSDHTYHYYLTAPLIGAAWCAGAALDTATARLRRPMWALALAVVLAGGLTVEAAAMVREIETHPFVLPELRADPVVDRARIAERVRVDLAAASLPEGVTLRFWSPMAMSMGRRERPDAPDRETYWERNFRAALLDGLAVRVLFPQVHAVEFVRSFGPAAGNVLYALYRPDGRLRVTTPEELTRVLEEHPEWR